MTTNAERAQWAQCCAHQYALLTGADEAADTISDLIASLGHYAQTLGLDYLSLVRIAIGHWHVEQTDPESIDPLPRITITIHCSAEEVVS